MKRILIILICLLFLISGCSKPEEQLQPSTQNNEPTETASQTEPVAEPESVTELYAVSVPAISETTCHENGTELFTFTSQHMQLILPNPFVSEKIVLDFLNRVDVARTDAKTILTAAQADFADKATWYPYFYQVLYSPTRIDHGVLSLFGMQNSFSGGVHGNKSGIAVNYDLMTGDILTLGSIMHAEASKEDFINLVNAKLSDMVDDYNLYDDYEAGVQQRLGGDENLYEDFFFTPTGLNFFFSPYEIAPYSSGFITVEIPYNELPGLIYDGYFPAERELISGTMGATTFDISNTEKFSNMAEVNLSMTGTPYVVYPEGRVENICVNLSGDNKTMPDYTVFAAFEMSDNDAVVINLDESMVDRITVSYASNNEKNTISLP